MQNESNAELYVHEWIAVATISGFIAMLAVCSYFSSPPLSVQLGEPHHLLEETIQVFVEGSVVHPGAIRVPRGATMEKVLSQAALLPEADVKNLNMKTKVRANQTIKIRSKKSRKVVKNNSLPPSQSE